MTASRADAGRGRAPRGTPVEIAGESIPAGRHKRFDIRVARLPTGTWLSLPVSVLNGRGDGPLIWLSATIHGDELNGIEIIRRVMATLEPRDFNGAVIAVPIVNVFGFVSESRYLPDRRDLNRSFPGSARGSLAGRLANLFIEEIARPCAFGLDFHTGSNHRVNLPQIRANLDDEHTRNLAAAFRAPVMINSKLRDGSLREVAARDGTVVLLYEGGEAQRFDEDAIATGVEGTMRVLAALGMIEQPDGMDGHPSLEAHTTTWVRARRAGILRLNVTVGDRVKRRDVLGEISDAFGDGVVRVRAPSDGIVIGHTRNPLTSQGDGLVHIAEVR